MHLHLSLTHWLILLNWSDQSRRSNVQQAIAAYIQEQEVCIFYVRCVWCMRESWCRVYIVVFVQTYWTSFCRWNGKTWAHVLHVCGAPVKNPINIVTARIPKLQGDYVMLVLGGGQALNVLRLFVLRYPLFIFYFVVITHLTADYTHSWSYF